MPTTPFSYKENISQDDILDGLSDGLFILDGDTRVQYENREARRIFGDVVSQPLSAFLSGFVVHANQQRLAPQDWPPHKALRDNVRVRQEGVWERIGVEPLYLEVTATPVLNKKDERLVLVSVRSIAAQLALERELREFIAITSHQLRTPVSSVTWLLEVLLAGKLGELNEEQREFVTKAREASLRLADTVRLILDASRIEMGAIAIHPEPVDLGKLIHEEIEKLKLFLDRKKHDFVVELPATPPTVSVDATAFRFIFTNLFSNAIKYTPNGGKITVRMVEEPYRIKISVIDTGIGILKKDQARLFTKFFRGENALMTSDGTGLGLYVVKLLLDRAGGNIWFESAEDHGSTFTFTIPREGFHRVEGRTKIEIPARPLY